MTNPNDSFLEILDVQLAEQTSASCRKTMLAAVT
jgi:hypothetical protein